MRHWGLKAEVSDPLVSIGQRGQATNNKALSWLQGSSKFPQPIIGSSVSADFLEIGNALFSEPYINDPTLNEARKQFDQAAREIMPRLLDIIIIGLGLPDSIKKLLRAYSERFSRPTAA